MTVGRHTSARRLAKRAVKLGANQKISEFSKLIRVVKKRKLETVVEIGTAKGGTFATWCTLAQPDALLISIDLPGGMHGGGYSEDDAERFDAYGGPNQQLHFLRQDSHDQATLDALKQMLGLRKVDFLMIDGDHTYEGVRADYEMYSPLVADGGLIAFHDILEHPQIPDCQVDRLWSELRVTGESEEFTDPDDERGWGQWGGIGVLVHQA